MASQYSETKFILDFDDHSLFAEYFKTRDITGFSYTKQATKLLSKKKKQDAGIDEQIKKAIEAQPDKVQREIESDFRQIYRLANEQGSQNLMAEAGDQGKNVDKLLLSEMNNHDLSMWFFLKYPGVFEEAIAEQNFLDKGSWKRVPVVNKQLSLIESKKEKLEASLRQFFSGEARGKYCLVETFVKKDRAYIVAHLSDYPVQDMAPDEKTRSLKVAGMKRSIFGVYYIYKPSDERGQSVLEVSAKGGYGKQFNLLALFARDVLGMRLEDKHQTYDLNVFKRRNFTLSADPGEIEGWWLKSIELKAKDRNTKFKITVNDSDYQGADVMWRKLEDHNLHNMIQDMQIDRVDLQIKFPSTREHPKGTNTFYINWKDTCSLSDIDEWDQKAIALLRKSGIDVGFTEKNIKASNE